MSGATSGPLGRFVRAYLERAVNRRDLTAVDELVAADYTGGGAGWPSDREGLRRFYQEQAQSRPDWRIDVQSTLELGDVVAVHARAAGTVITDGIGRRRELEWLAQYRVADGRIHEIRVLSLVPLDDRP